MAVKAGDQISIVDVTDSCSVTLTADSFTIAGNASGVPATGGTLTTTVQAFRGDTALTSSSVSIGTITGITGASAVANGLTVTITYTTALTGGSLTIPITIDGELQYSKIVSLAVAKTGGTGQPGATGVSMRNRGAWATSTSYTAGTSGGTYIDIVTLDGSSYMCKSSHTSSNTNKPPNATYWTLASEKGEQGVQGIQGIQGVQGNPGANGADAITLVVTSSNGTIFKNASIATVLTAHVYKAGVEVTGSALTALGTIKWYKDGEPTHSATGQTLPITAGDVDDKVTYIAQLEG